MILPAFAPESIASCADFIRAGGIIGIPTETVYGLGADADNEAAVAQIFATKGRPADHPLIVHVSSQDGGMGEGPGGGTGGSQTPRGVDV